jgi:hypothetical protein
MRTQSSEDLHRNPKMSLDWTPYRFGRGLIAAGRRDHSNFCPQKSLPQTTRLGENPLEEASLFRKAAKVTESPDCDDLEDLCYLILLEGQRVEKPETLQKTQPVTKINLGGLNSHGGD